MQRGRLLIVVFLLLILVVGGGGAFLALSGVLVIPGVNEPPTPTAEVMTATPEPNVEIVAAVQVIDRGSKIQEGAVALIPWPKSMFSPGFMLTDTTEAINKRARYTLQRGEPIFSTMLVDSLQDLSPTGSDAAAQIPPGFVALSIPYQQKHGVDLAIRDGDHVSVIVSWALVDIDQNFQTILPNISMNVVPPASANAETGAAGSLVASVIPLLPDPYVDPYIGQVQTDPVSGRDFYQVPQENQRPRFVTQGIIQDAMVLHLGTFYEEQPKVFVPTPTPDLSGTPTVPPPPTATPKPPESVTLVVSPQDALVLEFAKRLADRYPGAVSITLALRSAGDTAVVPTESVTLQYMFDKFSITLPSKLQFGIAPGDTPTPVPQSR